MFSHFDFVTLRISKTNFMLKKLILIYTIFHSSLSSFAQISEGGIPLSFTHQIKGTIPVKTIDIELINNKKETANSSRAYVGNIIETDITLENSGIWQNVKNGKLWQLKIVAQNAKAISLYYNAFDIPEGATFFIYNPQKTTILGAFTSKNNPQKGKFATVFTKGDEVILEYYVPNKTTNVGKISVNEINYAFQNIDFEETKNVSGTSGECQININCKGAEQWENEKNATIRWLSRNKDGSWWCSGTIINNANQDFTPYILSSEHNILDDNYLPAESSYFQQFQFYFNYESTECESPSNINSIELKSMIGCTLKASSGANGEIKGSDFLLLELIEDIPDTYNPYFAGWNRLNLAIDSGYCVHHPQGDLKKISKSVQTLSSNKYSNETAYWSTSWQAIGHKIGTTEAGSSGSALFNTNKEIVGTLTSGRSSCSEPTKSDYFGKFSYHWNLNGSNPKNQLKTWLDPNSTGIFSLKGSYKNANSISLPRNQKFSFAISPNPAKEFVTIEIIGDFNSVFELSIFDISGKKLKSDIIYAFEKTKQVNLSNLAKGTYILKLSSEEYTSFQKMLKIE